MFVIAFLCLICADVGAPIPIPQEGLKNSSAVLVQVYQLADGKRVAVSEETNATPTTAKSAPKPKPIQTAEPPKAKAGCDCVNCVCEDFNGGKCPCGSIPKAVPRQMPRLMPLATPSVCPNGQCPRGN